MKRSIFKKAKRRISFVDYMEDVLADARRIREISPGRQRYSGAQFELALISFTDMEQLKKEMDPDLDVDFTGVTLKMDWFAGFDWLDLSVSYKDEDAIAYFHKHLNNPVFYRAYTLYKEHCRPDCALQHHEANKYGLTTS
ncbi:Uncharacterised protein [Legionella lansingensis]|uniref:Uncharacterized protein n=1 Tax=Legionella lansingensis TaxID=45067 RepID=A0A0W0V7Z9_9GAMM|nr:hypothetical protein [Legionella lansingensis]KTD15997.1 hypothetical protein Llan_2585 [Legionella lansingensis]SNV56328.1 Uncharacterised protein [Legionella lansingensis]